MGDVVQFPRRGKSWPFPEFHLGWQIDFIDGEGELRSVRVAKEYIGEARLLLGLHYPDYTEIIAEHQVRIR